jgi:hypothetical protein
VFSAAKDLHNHTVVMNAMCSIISVERISTVGERFHGRSGGRRRQAHQHAVPTAFGQGLNPDLPLRSRVSYPRGGDEDEPEYEPDYVGHSLETAHQVRVRRLNST